MMLEHVTSEEFDEYLCGRVSENRIAAVEEHLLLCAACRRACTQAEAQRIAIRQAASEIRSEVQPTLRWWGLRTPVPVLGAVAAVAIGVIILTNVERHPSGVSDVSLIATRSAAANAGAQRGTALRLHLDTTSLDTADRYAVELVDVSGRKLWTGAVHPDHDSATVSINKAFAAGRYWVRLNSVAGEPLREFQLCVR